MPKHRIGPKGLALVKAFEGFVPYVYDDMVPSKNGIYREWNGKAVKGTLTIGYGHTNAGKHPLKIVKGLRVTEPQALEILDVDMDECEADVNRLVTVPITQGQFDALASFTFNCGAGSLGNIARRLNRGDYNAAKAAFDLYVKSKGVKLAGLVRRRDAEQALWDDRYVILPTEAVDHPAEVDDEAPVPAPPDIEPIPKPPAGSPAVLTPAQKTGGGIGAVLLAIAAAAGVRWQWIAGGTVAIVGGFVAYRIWKGKAP